ncbi:MAG: PQQ-like beta-propeller repeat protein [Verrucomicrobia bacterium]|nr:PQQ-like beta-propeller repeat protein [Verrucomicrobiota bacterium]
MTTKPFPLFVLTAATLTAADWPQVHGVTHDRKTAEKAPVSLVEGALKKSWEISTGGGFSSFVTGDGRAYTVTLTTVDGKKRETAIAVDRKTGRQLWETPLAPADYRNGGERGAPGNNGGDGPRSTPVFAGGRVFVFGGEFDLHALDAATGKVLWSHHLLRDFGGKQITWNSAASPLVLDDRVIVYGGGEGQSYLAFRAATGALLWKTGTDRPTHTTPIAATLHGKQQALFMVARGLVSLDPADGKELWHYPFPHVTSTAASPVVWQDIVNVSAAYGVGGGACRVTRTGDKWDVTELWRVPGDRETAAHWSTAVVHEGFLYGCYGRASESFGTGPFKCIDIRTGKIQWARPGFGPGQVIMAGGKLIASTDTGVITIIDPKPDAYHEVAKADLIDGKVWSTPIVSDGQLLIRSTTHGVCYEL